MKFALNLPKLPTRKAKEATADDRYRSPMDAPKSAFDRKWLLRVAALLVVAGVAGQLVNSRNGDHAPRLMATVAPAELPAEPTQIETVSSAKAAPLAEVVPEPAFEGELAAAVLLEPLTEAAPAELPAAPALAATVIVPLAKETVILAAAEALPLATPPLVQAQNTACPVNLDLAVVPGAMISVTLIAPCAPNARVVLLHEGLTITGMTTATGALFTALPALNTAARIQAILADGTEIEAALEVPEAADFRRFGVQWQGEDAFQVNAYQNDASFGAVGHIYGVQPGLADDAGGFLQILGDPAAPMPLLAEIYTYPVRQTLVEIVVEAAVTPQTCGREMLGETIMAEAGQVLLTELTVFMPDCSAVGDFLVLNNLALDATLAAN